jgi:DNA-binding FrmR family transcriptional regulator
MSSHKMPEVISRLSKIEGHIRGIKKMAEDGRSCEEILLQISAVKAAINKTGIVVLEDYLEDCVEGCDCKGQSQEVLENMKKAIHRFV